MSSPVLFITFNRPEQTLRVLKKIAEYSPKKIYISSDGPRKERNNEKEIVNDLRMKIKNNINWNCEVFYLFNKNNLGCKKAVSSAIDWFFNNEESGIILEDDCLPSKSFFKFCELMLVKYKNDTRIFHIDGTNFCESSSHYMYEFSKYALIWGWASWKRAWLKYDLTMNDFPEFKRKNSLNVVFNKKIELKYWYKMLSNAD